MRRRHPIHGLLLATTALAPFALSPALANPQGAQVVGGAATVAGTNTPTVTVTQTTDRAIINWQTFNIGAGETTRFVQPDANSIALNRVTGGFGASVLDGTLSANGRVFLVNPDGILIGQGARIDTGGFLATTHDIANADFMAGRYNFNIPGRPDASIVNQGTITASTGGFAALVAPGVRNTGTITATLGTVSLAAGNGFSLDLYGDKLITLGVSDAIAATVKDVATGQPLDALIKNEGKLKANGGRVELTAAATRQVVDSVINNTGVIEARSIGTRAGKIVLGAATATTKPNGAPAQTVKLSGKLSVAGREAGTKGGTIEVTGEHIALAGAALDASGAAGGGTVLIGGDVGGGVANAAVASILQARLQDYWVPTATTVSIDAASTIDASATAGGDGGKVVVWSDGATRFYGAIMARGGVGFGDGGFVEVSGKQVLAFGGMADTSAANGRYGTLLLDPGNVTIQAGGSDTVTGGSGGFVGSDTADSILTVATLQAALATNNVIVATSTNPGGTSPGNILVASNVSWSSNSTLTLSAYNNIEIQGSSVIANTGAGSLVLRADSTGKGSGYVVMTNGGVDFRNSTGTVSIYYDPIYGYSYPNSPYNYSTLVAANAAVPDQVTAYMLVNTLANLTAIDADPTTRAGTYALGRDIDGGGASFTPISAFNGVFDGLFHSISNVTINGAGAVVKNGGTIRNLVLGGVDVVAGAGDAQAGVLAGLNTGTISNVVIVGAHVQASHDGQAIGGLVGENAGLIIDSVVDGTVSGGSFTAIAAGGIAGWNTGAIYASASIADVAVGTDSIAGGLVGNGGVIIDSFAGGAVTGGSDSVLGGLVGVLDTDGIVTGSYASGSVTSTGPNSWIGGLAGINGGVITSSFAFGAVEGTADSVLGGLAGMNLGYINLSGTGTGIGTGPGTGGSVTATGANNALGGLVGANFGGIVLSWADVPVSGGAGNIVGGLVGANAAYDNVPPNLIPLSTFPTGTINGSIATGTVSGGANSTVGAFVGINGPRTLPANPGVVAQCGDTICSILQTAQLVTPPDIGRQDEIPPDVLATALLVHFFTTTDPVQQQEAAGILIALTQPTDSTPATDTGTPGQPAAARQGGTPGVAPPPPLRPVAGPDGERFSSVPPPGETRFLNNEVVLQVGADIPAAQIAGLAQQLGLTVLTSESLDASRRTVFRFRINNGRSVRDIIRALEANRITAIAQPNYRYQLTQAAAASVAGGHGDPAQYMMDKLHLAQAHRLASGRDVVVALVDSEVDKRHTELNGAISQEFDAVGAAEKAHPHGTAMAGAISSRDRLMGVAPGAKILAVRAFGAAQATAEGTTYSIIKGIDWAVSRGARVINMSFAGPNDPSLQRALKAAHDKGVVLVAAAGNAGPKSPPLYPAADPSVIAVTATDSDDKLFKMANRGAYVSMAAPGVEILAPAPDEAYQFSTGTSIATAHISGVVAMMLERDPALTPQEVRRILESTATDLGAKGRDSLFGWGLVNPERALLAIDARKKTPVATPAVAPR